MSPKTAKVIFLGVLLVAVTEASTEGWFRGDRKRQTNLALFRPGRKERENTERQRKIKVRFFSLGQSLE